MNKSAAIFAAAFAFLTLASAPVFAAQVTTTSGNMNNYYNMRVNGTLTVVRGGKTTVYKDGDYFAPADGDKMTLDGSLASLAGNGKPLTLTSKGGPVSFNVSGNGVYDVTSGSLSVARFGQTGTAGPGQTVKVVQNTTTTTTAGGASFSYTWDVVVAATSSSSETRQTQSVTTSPSTP